MSRAPNGTDAVAWFGRQSFVGGLAGEPGPGPAAPPLSVEPLDLHPSTCACSRCELDAAAVRRVLTVEMASGLLECRSRRCQEGDADPSERFPARRADAIPPPARASADTEPAAAIPANLGPHIEDVAAREQQRGRELACVRFVELLAELGRVAAVIERNPATVDDARIEEAWQFRHDLLEHLTQCLLDGQSDGPVRIQRGILWEQACDFVRRFERGTR